MNANSKLPAPVTISNWLADAAEVLMAIDIHSARLDALILLEDAVGRDRSWLLAHGDTTLTNEQLQQLDMRLDQRRQRIPIAYIRGFVEFYGRRFTVNPRVLIPRPETEEMIDLIKSLPDLPRDGSYPPVLIDVATGSGCIGITARLERPELEVWLTDIDMDALAIARHNFRALKDELQLSAQWKLQYYQSDLLDRFTTPGIASIITANLPYLSKDANISPDAAYEPSLALYANDDGYALIERLLPQAAIALLPGGFLVLESDPHQQHRILMAAKAAGFAEADRRRFHLLLQRQL